MLILRLNAGEEVFLFDEKNNRELGKIKFIHPQEPNPYKVPLGFELPNYIKILRGELVNGNKSTNRKDATNGGKKR